MTTECEEEVGKRTGTDQTLFNSMQINDNHETLKQRWSDIRRALD